MNSHISIFLLFFVLLLIACKYDQAGHPSEKIEVFNIEEGRELVSGAQSVLASNLLQAINTHGTTAAVKFCSEKAIFLTDSVSESLNVELHRVSDKNRNPENQNWQPKRKTKRFIGTFVCLG